MALSIDFQDLVSFLLTIQATGPLTLAPAGLTPAEYTSLALDIRSCAFVPFDSAASNDQPIAAMVEGQNSPSFVGGISALEEAVLGTAPVGARLFLLQFWECNR